MEAQRALVSQSNLKKKENQCLISNYTTEPQQKTKQNKIKQGSTSRKQAHSPVV